MKQLVAISIVGFLINGIIVYNNVYGEPIGNSYDDLVDKVPPLPLFQPKPVEMNKPIYPERALTDKKVVE